jgi:hypothetical protein
VTLGAQSPLNVISRFGTNEVPERVRSLGTFETPDYIDSFTLQTVAARERSAEGWARAVLEEAALSRRSARRLWQLMGLRLGPAPFSARHVQGWRIAEVRPDWIRLQTESWYLSAQAVCLVEEAELSLSLSLRYDNGPVARFVWRFVEGPHQKAVPIMLRQAAALVGVTPSHTDR